MYRNLDTVKLHITKILSIVLVTTVLLPFAIQFSHSLEKHDHICSTNDLHIDTHELDCSVFHFRINHNSIDFPSEKIQFRNSQIETLIISLEAQVTFIPQFEKPSRAPPVLLFT